MNQNTNASLPIFSFCHSHRKKKLKKKKNTNSFSNFSLLFSFSASLIFTWRIQKKKVVEKVSLNGDRYWGRGGKTKESRCSITARTRKAIYFFRSLVESLSTATLRSFFFLIIFFYFLPAFSNPISPRMRGLSESGTWPSSFTIESTTVWTSSGLNKP